ncbi:hypothetical protein K0M31_015950, partial [Melipona bicolor]
SLHDDISVSKDTHARPNRCPSKNRRFSLSFRFLHRLEGREYFTDDFFQAKQCSHRNGVIWVTRGNPTRSERNAERFAGKSALPGTRIPDAAAFAATCRPAFSAQPLDQLALRAGWFAEKDAASLSDEKRAVPR